MRFNPHPAKGEGRRKCFSLSLFDDITARLGALPVREKGKAVDDAVDATATMRWMPNPGPQTEAYLSAADILLFGGQGGGGKSDLGLGLAFTAHRRSLIVRRRYANLGALTERAIEINGSTPPKLRMADGRHIEFGANQHAGDELGWQGQPFDLKVFDEACQLLESQVRFHLG